MQSRKLFIAIGIAIVVAIVLVVVLKNTGETKQTVDSSAAGSTTTKDQRRDDRLPGGSDVSPESRAKFDERKAAALPKLTRDLERRLQQCGAEAMGDTPRALTVTMSWDPRLSTPELQRFVVTSTAVVDASSPLSAAGARCLDTFSGETLNVLLPANELPRRDLSEGISLGIK